MAGKYRPKESLGKTFEACEILNWKHVVRIFYNKEIGPERKYHLILNIDFVLMHNSQSVLGINSGKEFCMHVCYYLTPTISIKQIFNIHFCIQFCSALHISMSRSWKVRKNQGKSVGMSAGTEV